MTLSYRRLFGTLALRIACALFVSLFFATTVKADSPASLFKKGEDLEAKQDYEGAFTAYQEAWREKPKDVKYRAAALRACFLAGQIHVHRGQQLRDAGKLDEALVEFQKAATTDPSSFIASQEVQRTQTMIESAKNAAEAKLITPPPSFIQRKLEKAEVEPVELQPISRQPITLKMTEDTKLIYQMVGNLAGINVLFDLDVPSRKIHLELNGVTLAQALQLISMESRTFWRAVTPNTIFIAPDTPTKRKELEENVIKTFYLRNLSQQTELQDVISTLRTLLEVNRVTPIPSLNAIAIRGTPDQIALADKLINDLDKGHPEVVVDIAVMQVSRDRIHDLGINVPTSATVYPQSNVIATTTSGSGSTTTSTGNSPGQIKFGHVDGTSFAVNIPAVTANFLLSDSNSKLIQNPQIRSADGQKATLKIGDRVPVATGSFQAGVSTVGVSPLVNTQFQYMDVGVNIDITPYVHGDRSVTLKISMDVSSVTGSVDIGGLSQPIIGQRRIEHEIRLKEGEVNMLGGILEDSDIKSMSGYPGLSSIPILKYLFSDQHTEKRHNEIVFVMTPHIVRGPDVSESNMKVLSVGTSSLIQLPDLDTRAAPQKTETSSASPAPQVVPPSPVQQKAPAQSAPATQSSAPTSTPPPPPTQPASPSAEASAATVPQPVQFSFGPQEVKTTVGQTFTVDLLISNAQNIALVPLVLQYDPAKLQVVNVSNGSFLEQGQQVVALTQRDDPAAGALRITAARPAGSGGASGSGTLVTLTMTAKSDGISTLAIGRAGLRNATNQAVPAAGIQGSVEIKQASTAEASAQTKH